MRVRPRSYSTVSAARVDHRSGSKHDPRRVAVALGRQVHHQHARAVGRLPPVLGVRPAEAAPEDRVVEPELPPGSAASGRRGRRDPAGSRPASACRTAREMRWPSARLRTSDSPLTRNSSGMTYHGPIRMRPSSISAPEPRLLFGPDLEVVLEHDGLAVEMEVLVSRIAPPADRAADRQRRPAGSGTARRSDTTRDPSACAKRCGCRASVLPEPESPSQPGLALTGTSITL